LQPVYIDALFPLFLLFASLNLFRHHPIQYPFSKPFILSLTNLYLSISSHQYQKTSKIIKNHQKKMTILSSTNQLPSMKLPSIFTKEEWTPVQTMMPAVDKMSTDILLPPIQTTVSLPPLPDSPPYSSCSSLSVSSLPSSPDSVSGTSFPSCPSVEKKKGSIQSLLNSGTELLAFEQDEKINGYQAHFNQHRQRKKIAKHPYSRKQTEDNRQIKGLRLFSKQVCDKVAEKGITTYNEVADELAAEIQQHSTTGVDQKNIRRRVYDALNVLMALDIITKDRKQIKWLGISHDQQEQDRSSDLEQQILKEELRRNVLIESVQSTRHVLDDTINKLTRLEKLVERNQQMQQHKQQAVHLPFFMITSNQNIHTDYVHGKEASLQFGSSWMIYQDTDILTKLWPLSATTVVS
jgi:hypothetical protein